MSPRRTRAAGRIGVGIGGWVFAPWRGTFYPPGLVQRRELEYASRHVSAIEVNGTYYGAQKPATYAKWAAETPPGFVFAAKAPMRIVQARALGSTDGQVHDFLGGLLALGDRMGPVLWQFESPSLQADALADFIARLPHAIDGRVVRHAVEVRVAALATADLVAQARVHGVALVCAESPDYPFFGDATADFVYARLMRSEADVPTGYAPQALDAWAERVRAWSTGGEPDDLPRLSDAPAPAATSRDVFVFFISAAKVRNPHAAMALMQRLGVDAPR